MILQINDSSRYLYLSRACYNEGSITITTIEQGDRNTTGRRFNERSDCSFFQNIPLAVQ